MAGDKEKSTLQKAKDAVKKYSGYNFVMGVYDDLKEGEQLKNDIEKKIIVNQDGTPIKGKEGADNYAHSLTDAKIAQKGKAHAAVALAGGVVKEGVDLWNKIVVPGVQGQDVDVKKVLKDSHKDMQNNWRGIKWGLEHPTDNAEEHFAQLDLASNTIVPDHNNGMPQSRRLTTAEIMKRDSDLAQAKIKAERAMQGQRAAQAAKAAKTFDKGRIPEPKVQKKEQVQTPMAPTQSSANIPVPAWQQKAKTSR